MNPIVLLLLVLIVACIGALVFVYMRSRTATVDVEKRLNQLVATQQSDPKAGSDPSQDIIPQNATHAATAIVTERIDRALAKTSYTGNLQRALSQADLRL